MSWLAMQCAVVTWMRSTYSVLHGQHTGFVGSLSRPAVDVRCTHGPKVASHRQTTAEQLYSALGVPRHLGGSFCEVSPPSEAGCRTSVTLFEQRIAGRAVRSLPSDLAILYRCRV